MALYGDDLDVEALLEAPYKNNEGMRKAITITGPEDAWRFMGNNTESTF